MNSERQMFIHEQIMEQVRQDVYATFRVRNPQALARVPLTGMHAVIYGLRWIQFCKLPAFIH